MISLDFFFQLKDITLFALPLEYDLFDPCLFSVSPREMSIFFDLKLLLESQTIRSIRGCRDLKSPAGSADRTTMWKFAGGILINVCESWKRSQGWTCWFDSHSLSGNRQGASDEVILLLKTSEYHSESIKSSQLLSKAFRPSITWPPPSSPTLSSTVTSLDTHL